MNDGLYVFIGVAAAILSLLLKNRRGSTNSNPISPRRRYQNILTVPLSECEILTRIELEEEFEPNIMFPFAAMGNPRFYEKQIEKTICYIRYRHNEKDFLSGPINRSKEFIILSFDEVKFTTVHYDNDRDDDYFFDLEFLKQ